MALYLLLTLPICQFRVSYAVVKKKITPAPSPQMWLIKNKDLFLTLMSIMGQLWLHSMSSSLWTQADEPDLMEQILS